jgi:hypothetical protein
MNAQRISAMQQATRKECIEFFKHHSKDDAALPIGFKGISGKRERKILFSLQAMT